MTYEMTYEMTFEGTVVEISLHPQSNTTAPGGRVDVSPHGQDPAYGFSGRWQFSVTREQARLLRVGDLVRVQLDVVSRS